MANTGTQLYLIPPSEPTKRPLLSFSAAQIGPRQHARPNTASRPHKPSADRQGQRLTPQLEALREALIAQDATLSHDAGAPDPDMMVVFEVVDTIDRFVQAALQIQGLEFISDFLEAETDPDADFHYVDSEGTPTSKSLSQTLYLTLANRPAVEQLIRLFERWKENPSERLPTGLGPIKQLFQQLRAVREWAPQDRVIETGLFDLLQEEIGVKGPSGTLRVEVELVWRADDDARIRAQAHVEQLLDGAEILSSLQLPDIRYHAILAEIPASKLLPLLNEDYEGVELLCAGDVMFVSPSMTVQVDSLVGEPDAPPPFGDPIPPGPPKIALLDGYPLNNHDALSGRLSIDDPHDLGQYYPRGRRSHGTAMASLIIHGDLSSPSSAINTPLYCYPVMVPIEGTQGENFPPDRLMVDVIHEAFQHMFGSETPSAPSVRIINVSLGDTARPYLRRISPLARLLDYFAYTTNLVIIVSAGNITDVNPCVETSVIDDLRQLSISVQKNLYDRGSLRRIISPAESINTLSVGAAHSDRAQLDGLPDTIIDPLESGSIASYSPSGTGYGRSPKPDIHAPGGRMLFQRPLGHQTLVELQPARTLSTGPGIRVAAPNIEGRTDGTAYTYGTSNAAALVSRSAYHALDTLESLQDVEDLPPYPDAQFHPVLVRALLIHSATWPNDATEWATRMGFDGRVRRRELTRHWGFGVLDPAQVATAATNRVTLIGAGGIAEDQRHRFAFPLPPSLANRRTWRRLIVTLTWMSPIDSASRRYRVAELTCRPSRDTLRLTPAQLSAYRHMNGRGTVSHEVLEGDETIAFLRGDSLTIDVECRTASRLEQPVRYGLAVSLMVAATVEADIHTEVSDILRERVRVRAQP